MSYTSKHAHARFIMRRINFIIQCIKIYIKYLQKYSAETVYEISRDEGR